MEERELEKILIVDDDRYVRDVMAEALANPHFKIITAESGEHAIKLLKKSSFDLILSDLKMKKNRWFGIAQVHKNNSTCDRCNYYHCLWHD